MDERNYIKDPDREAEYWAAIHLKTETEEELEERLAAKARRKKFFLDLLRMGMIVCALAAGVIGMLRAYNIIPPDIEIQNPTNFVWALIMFFVAGVWLREKD